MRLDKRVSMAGVTRSEAKKLIARGLVKVNGAVVRDGGANVCESAEVTVGSEAVSVKKHIHLMLHKPAGVISATEDAKGAATVADLLPDNVRRRAPGPVGRLDKDVTGLILMTTDGQLAHRLISPKWEMTKRYFARVEGRLDDACVSAFEKGIPFKDFTAKPARLEILSADDEISLCHVFVTEGKFHQVKKMLHAVGHPVISLHREAIAAIELDPALSEGEWRYLTEDEENYLYKLTEMENA